MLKPTGPGIGANGKMVKLTSASKRIAVKGKTGVGRQCGKS